MLAMVRRQRTFCHHAQTNELSLEYSSLFGVLPRMMEVFVTKRRRSWEWRVNDDNGTLLMRGRERSRPAARYQCYRSLFLLLAVGRKSVEPRASRVHPEPEAGRKADASDLADLQRPARPLTPD